MLNIKEIKENYRGKLLYSEYYGEIKEDLKKWLNHTKKQGKTIAIWGGNIKGVAFLDIFDPKNEYISYVIDIRATEGEYIKNRKVLSCYDLGGKSIDTILFLNQKHIVQNLDIIKNEGISCDTYDVDEIVKRSLTFEDIMNHRDLEDDINAKEEMTKKIQNELMPLLEEVDRVCKKNDIQYFLCAGSALGAVRHKGFIPWDDDLDIGMLRNDYEKFLEIADAELKDGFVMMDVGRAPHYYVCHAKIFRDNTALVNRETSHLKIHHGFYLDIFPFDIIPEDEDKQEEIYKKQKSLRDVFCKCRRPRKYSGKNPIKKFIANEEYYKMRGKIGKKTYGELNRVLTQYKDEKPVWVADFSAPYNKKLFFKYNDIYPVVEGEFEGGKYPIPHNVDEYLKIMYGEYMELPPENKRYVKHDIVCFDTQHNYVGDEKWMKKIL